MSILRRTKIVCTIGPASESSERLVSLIESGMDVARLNFSHGTHKEHRETFRRIREAAVQKQKHVAILQDLSGPKLRTGEMVEPVLLQTGDHFILTGAPGVGDSHGVSISYPDLPGEVEIGDRILLADGSIQLEVEDKDGVEIGCRVIDGGLLSSHKGINVPHRFLAVEALTEKDKIDLDLGIELGVDFVALSFVRRPEDVAWVKTLAAKSGRSIPIVAKIEKHEALSVIDDIIEVSDGIMVARGDLAVETSLEQVPLAQKMIIQKCNQAGKPVITATQMLQSMIEHPRPTRAEAADVANAVLDGTDAVMLSEETAVGSYPIETVQMMDRIVRAAEETLKVREWLPTERHRGEVTIAAAVSHAVVAIAQDLNVAAILTPTRSGMTARMVARYRPHVPIVALSHSLEAVRSLSLVWGVYPLYETQRYSNSDELIARFKQKALVAGLVHKGSTVLIVAGLQPDPASSGRLNDYSATNTIRVETIEG